jgi:hypothetical protein
MKKPRMAEQMKDFKQGVFLVACPLCGWEQYYALYEIDRFFICPGCGVYSTLGYQYLDRRRQIVYWLQLVPDPRTIKTRGNIRKQT